jgi:hypothetical protein
MQNRGPVKGWRYIPRRGGQVSRCATGWVYDGAPGAAEGVMSSVRRITGANRGDLLVG